MHAMNSMWIRLQCSFGHHPSSINRETQPALAADRHVPSLGVGGEWDIYMAHRAYRIIRVCISGGAGARQLARKGSPWAASGGEDRVIV